MGPAKNNQNAINLSFEIVRRGGCVNFFGLSAHDQYLKLNLEQLHFMGHKIMASWAFSRWSLDQARQTILNFAAEHPDALHRSCLEGHFTGSSWVVDHHATRGLILLHSKVNRWLQPGGHADGDGFLQMVALREATEETGIVGLEVWSDPIDIDVHLIERRSAAEPAHLHLDVRYLVKAPKGAVFRGNHE